MSPNRSRWRRSQKRATLQSSYITDVNEYYDELIDKFLTKNEVRRLGEPIDLIFNRQNNVLEKMRIAVSENSNMGLQLAFHQANKSLFKQVPKDIPSDILTDMKLLDTGIHYRNIDGSPVFFTDYDESDQEMLDVLSGFKMQRLRSTYQEVINNDTSVDIIRKLKDHQSKLIKSINEELDEIRQTSTKVRRNTRLVIHVEHISIFNDVNNMLKQHVSNSDKISNALIDDIAILCGNGSPIYNQMYLIASKMRQLIREYGEDPQKIVYHQQLLTAEEMKIRDLSRNGNEKAIELFQNFCSTELQREITAMVRETPDIPLKDIYSYVTQMNLDERALWDKWEDDCIACKDETFRLIDNANDMYDFYKIMAKAISIMSPMIKGYLSHTDENKHQLLLIILSANDSNIYQFYLRCFRRVNKNLSWKLDLAEKLQFHTALFEMIEPSEIANVVQGFEEHVKHMDRWMKNLQEQEKLSCKNNSQPNKGPKDNHNNIKQNQSGKAITNKPNVTKNDRDDTNLKTSGKTTTGLIATQDTIDKARDKSVKELGTTEFAKIKARVLQIVAPKDLPSVMCYKCLCSNVTFKNCPRCMSTKHSVSFQDTNVIQVQQPEVFTIRPESLGIYQYKGKVITTDQPPIYAQEDSGCEIFLLLSKHVDSTCIDAIKNMRLDGAADKPTKMAYRGITGDYNNAKHVRSIGDEVIVQGAEANCTLLGLNQLEMILEMYGKVRVIKDETVLIQFNGSNIIELKRQNKKVWMEVHHLLLLLQAIMDDHQDGFDVNDPPDSPSSPSGGTDHSQDSDHCDSSDSFPDASRTDGDNTGDNHNQDHSNTSSTNNDLSDNNQCESSNNQSNGEITASTIGGTTPITASTIGGTTPITASTIGGTTPISANDQTVTPKRGDLTSEYRKYMDSYRPKDDIEFEEMDTAERVHQLNEYFTGGHIPELFFIKDGNNNHRAFLTTSGEIGFLILPSSAYPNVRDMRDVSAAEKYAQVFSNLFGNPNKNSIKRMLKCYTNLPFTIEDYDSAKVIFGNIHEDLANIKKKRSSRNGTINTSKTRPPPEPPPTIDGSKTTIPGVEIHADIKQIGGAIPTKSNASTVSVDSKKINVVHGVDSVTGLIFAVTFTKQSEFSNALLNLITKFNIASIDSKVKGVGRVKIIRFDSDPIITNTMVQFFANEHGVKIMKAQSNYYERRAEISIQHVDRVLSRLVATYPLDPPAWLMAAFWIAICEILNFLISYPNVKSPSEQYRGYKTDIMSFSWLPVGSLVMVRKEDKAVRQRDPQFGGEDSIVGKSKATVAILLGIKYDNHRYAREYIPITDNNFTKKQYTMRNFTSNPRSLPHILELFPQSLWKYKKQYDNLSKLYVLQQTQTMNLPDVSDLQNAHCVQYSSWVVCPDTEILTPTEEDYEVEMHQKSHVNHTTKREKTQCNELIAVYQDNNTNSVKISEYPEQSELTMEVFHTKLVDNNVSKIAICKPLLKKVLATYNSENDEAANILIDIKDNNFADLMGAEYYNSKYELSEANKYKEALIDDLKDEAFRSTQRLICSNLVEQMQEIMINDPTMKSELLQYYNDEMVNRKSVFLSSANMSFQQVLKQSDPKMVEHGLQAIENEKSNLIKNEVIEFLSFSEIPEDKRKEILNSFIFTVNKFDANGKFVKSKARCVAGGNTQLPSTYNRTSSPVVSKMIVFLILQLWTEPDYNAYQLDISEAFCKVELKDHEIYIRTDKAFHDGTNKTKYARLLKCLYGLKQAAFEFYIELKKVLAETGFSPTAYDGGLFYIKEEEKLQAVALVHVDDFLLLTRDDKIKDTLYKNLESRFKKVSLDKLSNFCGLSLEKTNDRCVKVNQQHYLATLGNNIDITDDIIKYQKGHKWKLSPWDTTPASVTFGQSDVKIKVKRYQQLLGSVLYAVNTRPDIQSMVTILATRQNDPREDDYAKLVRVAWYLRKTSDKGLIFYPIQKMNGVIQLYGTADGSYDGMNGGVGRSGITLSLGPSGTPFCCISRRQQTRSRSSTEAEVKAWNHCAAIVSHVINILNNLGYKQGPVLVETDNRAASHATTNPNITEGLSHLDPKFWYCRVLYQQRKILFCYVHTNKLLADPLSKVIQDKKKFDDFSLRLLGCNNKPHMHREIMLPNGDKKDISGVDSNYGYETKTMKNEKDNEK